MVFKNYVLFLIVEEDVFVCFRRRFVRVAVVFVLRVRVRDDDDVVVFVVYFKDFVYVWLGCDLNYV